MPNQNPTNPYSDPDAQKLTTHRSNQGPTGSGGATLREKVLTGTIPYWAALNMYSLGAVIDAFKYAGWGNDQLKKLVDDWNSLHPANKQPNPFKPPGTPPGPGNPTGGGGGGSGTQSALQAYIDTARQFGEHIDMVLANKLLAGRVSLSEWTDRLRANETIKNNPGLFAYYNDALKRRGLKPLNEDGLLTFMVGKAPRPLYNIFNEASFEFANSQAGEADLSNKKIRQLSAAVPTGFSVPQLQKGYADMVKELKLLPYSRLHKLGLSRSELIQLEFGGPLQAQAKEKVNRIVNERKVLAQGPVEAQAIPTNQGVRTIGLEGISGPASE